MANKLRDVEVFARGSAMWDRSRRLFDASLSRYPSVVYRPLSITSAIQLVAQLQQDGQTCTVRSGGHSAAGLSVRDDVALLDLSALRRVRVNLDNATATLEGGAQLADLDAATAPAGLATTTGTVSTTGVVGLACGGGLGWLMGRFGLACDNIVEATIVADGETQVVNAGSPLLRRLRGVGTSLGFIAQLKMQLHEVERLFVYRMIELPGNITQIAPSLLQECVAALPDHVACSLTISSAPSGELRVAFEFVSPIGTPESAPWLAPLASMATRSENLTLPYPQVQRVLDGQFPFGQRSYRRSLCFDSFAAVDISALLAELQTPTSYHRSVTFDVLHGRALDQATASQSCFPRYPYVALLVCTWPSPDLDEVGRTAGRTLFQAFAGADSHQRVPAYGNYSSEPADSAQDPPS